MDEYTRTENTAIKNFAFQIIIPFDFLLLN